MFWPITEKEIDYKATCSKQTLTLAIPVNSSEYIQNWVVQTELCQVCFILHFENKHCFVLSI